MTTRQEAGHPSDSWFYLGPGSGVLTSFSVASPGASTVDWDSMFEESA